MNRKAFTLIELLVVIAIVGILSSVIYSNITGIRDRARITAGIRFDSSTLHSIGDMLVGEWLFDDASLGTAIDTSGSGNNGTVVGSPTVAVGYNGKGTYSFDGSSQYVTINGALNSLRSSDQGTWSAWIRSNDYTSAATQNILGFGYLSGTRYIRFSVMPSGKLIAIQFPYGWSLETNSSLLFNDGVWAHVAVVQNGVKPALYVNGVIAPATFTNGTNKTYWFANDSLFNTGRIGDIRFNASESYYFNGSVDDARIYTSALSGSEIQKLYTEGKTSHEVSMR